MLVTNSAYSQIAFEQDVVTDTQLNLQNEDFVFQSNSNQFTIEVIPDTLKWRRNAVQHLNPYVKIVIKNRTKVSHQKLKLNGAIYSPTMI